VGSKCCRVDVQKSCYSDRQTGRQPCESFNLKLATSFRQTEKQSTSQIENQLLSQKVITFSECTEKHFGNQLASGFNIQRAYTIFQYLQQITRYCRQQLFWPTIGNLEDLFHLYPRGHHSRLILLVGGGAFTAILTGSLEHLLDPSRQFPRTESQIKRRALFLLQSSLTDWPTIDVTVCHLVKAPYTGQLTPWLEFVIQLYRPSYRHLPAKLLPAFEHRRVSHGQCGGSPTVVI
jgi:hypothetical protein